MPVCVAPARPALPPPMPALGGARPPRCAARPALGAGASAGPHRTGPPRTEPRRAATDLPRVSERPAPGAAGRVPRPALRCRPHPLPAVAQSPGRCGAAGQRLSHAPRPRAGRPPQGRNTRGLPRPAAAPVRPALPCPALPLAGERRGRAAGGSPAIKIEINQLQIESRRSGSFA